MANEKGCYQVKPYRVTKWLSDSAIIELGDSDHDKLEVLHTPGHTPDSLSLWYNAAKRLFIGICFINIMKLY
ncbi:unnamed protein product [Brugia pahangi]|uniref:Lactamase_B domain-containing protein n=1 Tax=Brugia pahangi TaxID=6280 RepID=A0A0N4TZM9_BRUPA|nr:unnamed protein product [Brugia pahangi]